MIIKNIFTNNPYRITGLLAEATDGELYRQIKWHILYPDAQQQSEEDYSFPVFGRCSRTKAVVEQAAAKLSLDRDKLNAALFWFSNSNPVTDEPAFEALKNYNIPKAVEIWSEQVRIGQVNRHNWSAFHNLSTLLLWISVNDESINECLFKEAVILKLTFLDSDSIKELKIKTTDSTFNISSEEIQLSFLNTLQHEIETSGEIPADTLIKILSVQNFSGKKEFIRSFVKKTIEQIEQQIETARTVRIASNFHAASAGTELHRTATDKIEQLKTLLRDFDLDYSPLTDKAAEEIYQCGLAYSKYGHDSNTDTHVITMYLLKKAHSLATGKMARQKYHEEIGILQKWINEKRLKNDNYNSDDEKIINLVQEAQQQLVFDIERAKRLFILCKPLLNTIKNTFGTAHPRYISLSTQVAEQMQRSVIHEKNKISEYLKQKSDKTAMTNQLTSMLKDAWAITTAIGLLDIDNDFRKTIYEPNKTKLKTLCTQLGITIHSDPSSTSRSNAKSGISKKNWVVGCLPLSIIIAIISTILIYNHLTADKNTFNKITETPASYERFIQDYPDSKYKAKALDALLHFAEKEDITALDAFAQKYDQTPQAKQARQQVTDQCNSLYSKARSINTIEEWTTYKAKVPKAEHRDADKQIKKIETEQWSTDPKAWKQATSSNTIMAFQKYLTLFPNGNNKKQAEKKIIDIQVDTIFAGNYGQLPTMDKTKSQGGQTSVIHIKNKTSYTLTVLYSGNESRKAEIPAQSSTQLTLLNGAYRIAASVSALKVRSFAGKEELSGGIYDIEYYISTTVNLPGKKKKRSYSH